MPPPDRRIRVLVVDDKLEMAEMLADGLADRGYEGIALASSQGAIEKLKTEQIDALVTDLRMPELDGLALLAASRKLAPTRPVIVMTAFGAIDTAIESIRQGASHYLTKPFKLDELVVFLDRAMDESRVRREAEALRLTLRERFSASRFVAESQAMQNVLDMVERVAPADTPVLLLGETGTGKGVIARAIHAESHRASRPFVQVNCAALPEALLESELFGHAKGAFTGAVRDQEGKVEAAEGGTLFLDEIGELPVTLQAKLLRFLQDKQFERVGETRTRRADVRVVTATNRDLEAAVKEGSFREDLLYRLNTIEVAVPSLRERGEDILRLAERFLGFFAGSIGRPVPSLSQAARSALVSHSWPGNVRELRNAIERALILNDGPVIGPEAFGVRAAAAVLSGPVLGGDFAIEEIELEHIRRVIARTPTQEEAARILGVDASTLWRKKKKLES